MLTEQQISAAADLIRAGELVAFPTETVYGLGGNALDAIAIAKIFELKGRPKFDPLIVHIAAEDAIAEIVEMVPPQAQKLIDQFWPGPLSIVLQKRDCIPDIVTAGLSSVAVRCPVHDVARRLIAAAGVPVAAPSANRFGRISPTTASHVVDQFGDELQVLDGGPCSIGVESTVVSFVDSPDGSARLLRHGGIAQEQIEAVIGAIETKIHESSQPTSPGQLSRHYSPRTPLVIATDETVDKTIEELIPHKSKVGLLSFLPVDDRDRFAAVEILSRDGCLREAAANLFAALRRLDDRDLELIIALPVPEVDLGRAIMDRLRRAAAK